jgi:hypothetical protein
MLVFTSFIKLIYFCGSIIYITKHTNILNMGLKKTNINIQQSRETGRPLNKFSKAIQ